MQDLKIQKIEIGTLSADDIDDINSVLETSEFASICHTVEWHKIISKIKKKRCYFLLAKRGTEPVGVFPFYSTPKWGVCDIRTTSMLETRYGGPVALQNDIEVIKTLIKYYEKSMNTLIWYIHTSPRWDASILEQMNYQLKIRNDGILNLNKQEDDIWMGLKSRTRRAVRKATKNGVEIVSGSENDIDLYYKMVESTYERSNTPPPPKKLITLAYEKLQPKNMIRLMFAKYDGEYIGGLLPTMYNGTITYWGGADAGTNRSLQPLSLLFWEIIKWGIENGFQYYDMLGVEKPRLAQFKLSWGSEIVDHYVCTKKSNLFKLFKRIHTLTDEDHFSQRVDEK